MMPQNDNNDRIITHYSLLHAPAPYRGDIRADLGLLMVDLSDPGLLWANLTLTLLR